MGQDSPSNTQLAHKIVASLKDFLGWLPPQYKWIPKKYTQYILQHRSAIHRATQYLPILASLIVIQVERDIAHAEELTKVYKEIDNLRREIEQLKPAE